MPTSEERPESSWPTTPAWPLAVRLWVATLIIAVLATAWWSVRQFTSIVVLAVLLAYILSPVIGLVSQRLRLRRGLATALVYAAVAAAFCVGVAVVLQSAAESVASGGVQRAWGAVTENVLGTAPESVEILGHRVAVQSVVEPAYERIVESVGAVSDSMASPLSVGRWLGYATDVATGFVYTLFAILVTFFISLYVAADGLRYLAWMDGRVPEAYRPAYRAAVSDIELVWRRFFRGQLILALVVGGMTLMGLLVLGVPYAFALALIAGILEVVPRLGPVISVIPAVAVVLILPSQTLPGLPHGWLALLVIGLYVVIQQIENNVLVPRILGASVNLPPVVILVGALAGAKIAGVPGILLAAPLLGTARVLGEWLLHKVAGEMDSEAGSDGAAAADAPAVPPES